MGARKSAQAVAARKAAAERAAKFLKREQKLVDLAADYETAQDERASIETDFAKRRAALDAEQREAEAEATTRAIAAVATMITLGISKDEAAERLGIERKDVNLALRQHKDIQDQDAAGDQSTTATETSRESEQKQEQGAAGETGASSAATIDHEDAAVA